MIGFLALGVLILATIKWLPPNAMRGRGFIPWENAAQLQRQQVRKRVAGIRLLSGFVLLVALASYYGCIHQSDEGSTLKVLNSAEARHELFVPITWTGMVMAASLWALILTWPLKLTYPLSFWLILIIIQLGLLSCFLYGLWCRLKSIAVSVAAMKIPAFLFTLDAAFDLSVGLIAVFMLVSFVAHRFA